MSLEVKVKKRFQKFHLDVDFESGGGITGLLGASGCGKSMTLKCVVGIVTPDEGRIVLDGRVLFDSARGVNLPPQERRVGYLFQHYALFPNMTVAQNIAAGIPGREGRRDKVEALMKSFYLEDLRDKRPRQLSGGQQQRVALARILASGPEALLLDEPFSALDSYLKWQVELELSDLLDEFPGPVVFVTHDREEVYRLCAQACVMDHGRAQKCRPVKELFQAPATRPACLLSGCKNLSRVRVLPGGGVEALDWGAVLVSTLPAPEKPAYVGVRSHHLRPAAGGEVNQIPCRVERVIDDLFSAVVLLEPLGGEGSGGRLRLELPKEEWRGLNHPKTLTVTAAPEHVMLLSE